MTEARIRPAEHIQHFDVMGAAVIRNNEVALIPETGIFLKGDA